MDRLRWCVPPLLRLVTASMQEAPTLDLKSVYNASRTQEYIQAYSDDHSLIILLLWLYYYICTAMLCKHAH